MFHKIKNQNERQRVINEFLKNRKILKQQQLSAKFGKQLVDEQIELLQNPVVRKLDRYREQRDQQQTQLIRELQQNQQAIVGTMQSFPPFLKSLTDPIGRSTPMSMITETTLDDINLPLLNKYKLHSLKENLPDLDVLQQMNKSELKKLKKNVGSIITTQSRSSSKSKRAGLKDSVIREAYKYRDHIDFFLGANPSPKSERRESSSLTKSEKSKSLSATSVGDDDDQQSGSQSQMERIWGWDSNAYEDDYEDDLEDTRAQKFHREMQHSPWMGSGIKYYKSPNDLVKRLETICASIEAGNHSKRLKNEVYEILDKLLNDKIIHKKDYKKIVDIYIKER